MWLWKNIMKCARTAHYSAGRNRWSLRSRLYRLIWRNEGLEQGIEKGIVKGLEKGIEKGIEKGMEKGLEKGKRALLKSQIAHKYGKEDDWIDTLPDHQVEDAILHILECDTYDALKDRLKGKEVK